MSGFKPLGDLSEWHVWFVLILAFAGGIALVVWFIRAIVWMFTHLQIV